MMGPLEQTVQYQESRLNLLERIAERQQSLLERLDEQLLEVRRDAAQNQRLWVNLSRRYGWLDDADWE